MNIIAIDTSLEYCAAAVQPKESDSLTTAISEKIGRGHAEHLPKLIEELLLQAKMDIWMMDRIGVTIGPGSFTGMRVGISMAKGMAQVLRVPLIGVSTLRAIAAEAISCFNGCPVLVLLRARRSEYYVQKFNSDVSCLSEPQIKGIDDIEELMDEDIVLAGSGSSDVQLNFGTRGDLKIANQRTAPSLKYVCNLVAESESPFAELKPIYVRPPDAKPQTNMTVLRKCL